MLWDSLLPPNETGARAGFTVHRTKGQILIKDGRVLMIQGVRDVFEIIDHTSSRSVAGSAVAGSAVAGDESTARGKIVLIGKGLVGSPFQESLERALASAVS